MLYTMRRLRFLYLCLLLFCGGALLSAQEVHTLEGIIYDSDSEKGIHDVIVTVQEKNAEKKTLQTVYTITKQDGRFSFKIKPMGGVYELVASRMGYQARRVIARNGEPLRLELKAKAIELKEVVVTDRPVRKRGDTISYRAKAFISRETYSLEDILQKIPGLSVEANGIVKYLGESIQGVYIEGLNLLGGSYPLATRNLRAEDIATVEVLENFQPIKALVGVRGSDKVFLNIKMKNKHMLIPSGDVTLGGGILDPKERKALLLGKANAILINPNIQTVSILGANNMGRENFSRSWGLSPGFALNQLKAPLSASSQQAAPAVERLKDQQEAISGNAIVKLKEGHTLKVNANYIHSASIDKRSSSYSLDAGAGRRISYTEQWDRSINDKVASLELDYTANTDQLYLSNVLSGMLELGESHRFIERNGKPLEVRNKLRGYQFDDRFSYKKRRGADQISEFSLSLSGAYLPLNRLNIGADMEQNLWGHSWQANTMLGYGWPIGQRWTIEGGIALQGQYGALETFRHEAAIRDNSVHGGGVRVSSEPSLSYRSRADRIVLSLTVPLSLRLERYSFLDLKGEKRPYNVNRLSPGLKLAFAWKPSASFSSKVSFKIDSRMQNELWNFLPRTIYTDYDNKRRYTRIRLPKRTSTSLSYYLRYRRPIEGFFTQLSATLMQTIASQTTVSQIASGGGTQAGLEYNMVERESKIRIFNLNSSSSQHIYSLKSTAFLDLSASVSSNPWFRQGQEDRNLNTSFEITPRWMLSPTLWLSINSSLRIQLNSTKSSLFSRKNSNYELLNTLTLSPWSMLSLSIRHALRIAREGETKLPRRNQLSLQMEYRWKRLRIKATLNNLTNEQYWEIARFREGDIYTSRVYLRPMSLGCTLTWKY